MAKLRINTIYDGGQEGSIANMINSLKTSIESMQQQSFMRGVSGESVKSKVVTFKEILELAKVYDSNGYEVTDINGKINRIFSIDQSSEWRITNSISLKDIAKDWWYDKVKAMKFTVFYTGENTITNTPFLVFVDPRLEYINKYVNSGNCEFNDKSCIIAIRGNVSDGNDIKIEISPIFPRLYYNEGARSFCWEINGERTSVSAQGISGKDGESAAIKEVTAIYKNSSGDKKVYNIETTPNDTLIILTYNEGDKKHTCFDSSVTEYMDGINDGTMCIINILGVSDKDECIVDGYNNGKLFYGSEEIANVSTADVTFGVTKKNSNDNTVEIITNNIKFRNFIKTISGSTVFSDLDHVTFGNVEAEANNANTMSFKASNDAYNNIVSSYSTDGDVALSFVHGTHAQKAYSAANKDEYYKQMIGANKKSVLDIINYDVNIGTDRLTSNFAVHGQASFGNSYHPGSVYINSKVGDSILPASLNISRNNTFDTPLVNLYTSPSSQFLIRTNGDKDLTIQSLSPISGINDALTIRNNHTSNVNGGTISATKYANIVKIYNKLEARDVEMLGLLKFIPTSGYRRSGGIDLDNVKLRTDSKNNLNIVVNSICFGPTFDKMAWLNYVETDNVINLGASIGHSKGKDIYPTTRLKSNLEVNGSATVSGALQASNTTVGSLNASNTTISGHLTANSFSTFNYGLDVNGQLVLKNSLSIASNAFIKYNFFDSVKFICVPVTLKMKFTGAVSNDFKCDMTIYYGTKSNGISIPGVVQKNTSITWPRGTKEWCKKLLKFYFYGNRGQTNDFRIEPYFSQKDVNEEEVSGNSSTVVSAHQTTQILGISFKTKYKAKTYNDSIGGKPGLHIRMYDGGNVVNESDWGNNVSLKLYLLAYIPNKELIDL